MADERFTDRCHAALSLVQKDLDATGLSEYKMTLSNLSGYPTIPRFFAALPDGSAWSGGGTGGMTPDLDDDELVWVAADTACDALIEVLGVMWPVCAEHGGQPMQPADRAAMISSGTVGLPWWSCRNDAGHLVAQVGNLTAEAASADRIRT